MKCALCRALARIEELEKDRARLEYILAELEMHPNGYLYHRIDGKTIGRGSAPREIIEAAMRESEGVKP